MTQEPAQPTPATPSRAPATIEAMLSRLLTIAVILAAAVTLLGAALHGAGHGGGARPDLTTFRGQPERLTDPAHIAADAAGLDPLAVMQLGLVLLIATPVARVLFSLITFALRRDALYTVVTLIVLAGLALGLLGVAD